MHKLISGAVAAATAALVVFPASASDNPLRDQVLRWQQRMLERALGPDARIMPRPEIIGGTAATAGKWPFQVGLLTASVANNYNAQFCGGTLVSAQFVVTAAHCVTSNTGVPTAASKIHILFGTYSLASGGTRRTVAQIRVHPYYNPNTSNNDIAVIKLSTPATGIKFFATILAGVDENVLASAGKPAYVTGWGDTDPSGVSNYPTGLRQVQVPLVTRANCNDPGSYDGEITMQMICAGLDAGGKDSCQGDSGGPLVVKDSLGRWRTLAGVVSWGIGCAQPNLFGVYSRVATLGAWAKNTIKSLGGPTL